MSVKIYLKYCLKVVPVGIWLEIKECAAHCVSGSYSSYVNNSHVKRIRIRLCSDFNYPPSSGWLD